MPPFLLEARGLKRYFRVTKGLLFQREHGMLKAVDGVDFGIPASSTFGIVGESGCGKTTTTNLILLLLQKTAGTLLFDGADVHGFRGADLKRYRASVQAVFQDPYSSLNPRKRVVDIITEPIQINQPLHRQSLRERTEELLVQVGLSPHAVGLYPHEFSGGQRQRIAIARAVSLNPRLILLDEPVSALDVSIRAQIMNLLRDMQERLGLSYLLIAHNLATVRYMSNHVAVMYLGRIVERGECDEVYTHRLHPYTQALFAAALPGHPRSKWENPLPGEVPSPYNAPPGCSFHPRCSHAMPICQEEQPQLRDQSSGHAVACHLY
ncbi:MAG: ATP-binding cassette domain-containing protein [Chloroflexota bacterium]|nr:MAG: ATP-binding cassette domain-containing protein [Chloroflexota bacterium]